MESPQYHIYPLGDRGLTIELGKDINSTINKLVQQLFHQLQQNPIPFVTDIIPAYSSVSLLYDVYAIKKSHPSLLAYDYIQMQLLERIQLLSAVEFTISAKEIPVCYDPVLGPDLATVAAYANISVEELIGLHTQKMYTVYMIGFLPGFPYMASVDPRIQMPRKEQPRLLVPAGSVGIAGEQTGIYPLDSPGGWQIIGQTPIPLFDIAKESPCYLAPGEQVQFYTISLAVFYEMKKALAT